MSAEVGKCFGSIQDLIDLLEKVKYEYGNDTPIKIINPIDHNYVGNAKLEGMGKNGSLILSGLYIFGMTDEEIDKRVNKFVEENKKHIGIFDYVFIDDKDADFEREYMISYNQGLKDGYLGCLLEILKNINVEDKE
jgi:hypothetical protein